VGVQITPRKNEISVDFTYPSVVTSFLSAIFRGSGLWIDTLFYSSWWDLENEIVDFLRRKYA